MLRIRFSSKYCTVCNVLIDYVVFLARLLARASKKEELNITMDICFLGLSLLVRAIHGMKRIQERENNMNVLVLLSGEGRSISLGPIRLTVLEEGTRTHGAMAMAEFTVPPHVPGPFPHVHHAHEEGFYVLEGEIEFNVDGETLRAGMGSFVMVPIGVPHTFSNPGEHPARFLNTFTPPQYIHYFEEMSELMTTSGSLTREQRRAIMARYDTDVLE